MKLISIIKVAALAAPLAFLPAKSQAQGHWVYTGTYGGSTTYAPTSVNNNTTEYIGTTEYQGVQLNYTMNHSWSGYYSIYEDSFGSSDSTVTLEWVPDTSLDHLSGAGYDYPANGYYTVNYMVSGYVSSYDNCSYNFEVNNHTLGNNPASSFVTSGTMSCYPVEQGDINVGERYFLVVPISSWEWTAAWQDENETFWSLDCGTYMGVSCSRNAPN